MTYLSDDNPYKQVQPYHERLRRLYPGISWGIATLEMFGPDERDPHWPPGAWRLSAEKNGRGVSFFVMPGIVTDDTNDALLQSVVDHMLESYAIT